MDRSFLYGNSKSKRLSILIQSKILNHMQISNDIKKVSIVSRKNGWVSETGRFKFPKGVVSREEGKQSSTVPDGKVYGKVPKTRLTREIMGQPFPSM